MNELQKILIVDDKAANLFSLEQILKETNAKIIMADNGNDALIASLNHSFAIALLDVQMPGMDGYELAEFLRGEEKTKDLPIIFVSAVYASEYHVFKGYDAGAVDFLVKPYNPKVLLSKVNVFLTLDRQKKMLEASQNRLAGINDILEFQVQERTRKLNNIIHELQVEIEKRELAEKELIQAHKMEAIGSLAGGIAHDFNNILAAVLGYTELSMDSAPRDSPLEENLGQVYAAGLRAKDLVNQILNFARKTDEDPKLVRMDLVAKEVVKFLRSTIPTSIEIKENILSVSLILANPIKIHQLIMNICTNAAHAMSDSGLLSISLGDVSITPDNMPDMPPGKTLSPGMYQLLEISDTGCGISADIIDSIFDPFFTTKGIHEGTGMGLAMVNEIVKGCGGVIFVASEVGKGTVFTILLPTAQQNKVAQPTVDVRQLPTGTERILFVDDEQVICKVASRILEKFGYQVTSKSCSEEAFALFNAQPDAFDLVITDMSMPRMSGDELTRKILVIRPDIPVIISTGYSRRMTASRAVEIGARTLMAKPSDKKTLLTTVREVLDN
ncbi:response regulator [Desulfocicer niacini]